MLPLFLAQSTRFPPIEPGTPPAYGPISLWIAIAVAMAVIGSIWLFHRSKRRRQTPDLLLEAERRGELAYQRLLARPDVGDGEVAEAERLHDQLEEACVRARQQPPSSGRAAIGQLASRLARRLERLEQHPSH